MLSKVGFWKKSRAGFQTTRVISSGVLCQEKSLEPRSVSFAGKQTSRAGLGCPGDGVGRGRLAHNVRLET
jgi:hypothetical protein